MGVFNRKERRRMEKKGLSPRRQEELGSAVSFTKKMLGDVPIKDRRVNPATGAKREVLKFPSTKCYEFDPDKPMMHAMIIGHWIVGKSVGSKQFAGLDRPNTDGPVLACVSRCGVSGLLSKRELEGGGPPTCWACDETVKKGITRLEAKHTAELQIYWEDFVPESYQIDERNNLRAATARKEWEKLGRPLLQRVINATDAGPHFGWKVFIRTCDYNPAKAVTLVRAVQCRETIRSFEAAVRSADGNYTFWVDVATARTDRKIADLMDDFNRAAARATGADPARQLPAPSTNGHHQLAAAATQETTVQERPETDVVNVKQLEAFQSKIARLLTIGQDVNEIAAMTAKAEARLAAAAAREEEARRQFSLADEAYRVESEKVGLFKDRYDDAKRRADNALVDFQTAQERSAQRKGELDVAIAGYDGPKKELEDAKRELDECKRLSAETLKAVGDADKLAVLLKALNSL